MRRDQAAAIFDGGLVRFPPGLYLLGPSTEDVTLVAGPGFPEVPEPLYLDPKRFSGN
jgi:hypothetical protein